MAKQQQVVQNRNVANNAIVRMVQRIAKVQELRKSKHAARVTARNQVAFVAKMQELAVQYGIPAAQLAALQQGAAPRANSATVAPSRELVHVAGGALTPCAAVHALCATLPAGATRADMVQLCTDNGINVNTAKTQVGKYRAALAKAAEQDATE